MEIAQCSSMERRGPHSRDLRKGRYSQAGRIYFITTRCHLRKRVFTTPQSAQIVFHEFDVCAKEGACENLAYVAMPDHVHWLMQLRCDVELHEVVRRLKGRSARKINLSTNSPSTVWQKGFHDHALRREEDIETLARYLIQNPVRAGLVKRVKDYPYWYSVWHPKDGIAAEAAPTIFIRG